MLVSLLFGLVTYLCCIIFGYLVRVPLGRRIKPWRIWHEVLCELTMIVFISICNVLLASLVFDQPITLPFLLSFLYMTFIIGIIITILSTTLNYQRRLRNKLETLLETTKEEQAEITITIRDTSVRGNDLQLNINDLLYIESQRNHVVVYYLDDHVIRHVELHTTLTAVLGDLQEYENIFQCHRSFVVNLNNITSAQGNSNGYQLTLANSSETVPVSRSYVQKLKSFIA